MNRNHPPLFGPVQEQRSSRWLDRAHVYPSHTFVSPLPQFRPHLHAPAIVGLLLLLAVLADGQETNLPANSIPAKASPQEVVAAYEKAGKLREAAAVYEELARTNSVARKVVAGRLVTIYTQTGETNQALAWAREVMRENPDPQAYLAAVQARLGQHTEAQAILERELAANTNATRAVTLRWQLAEVCEKLGKHQKAQKHLADAAEAAKDTPMAAAARRRLKESAPMAKQFETKGNDHE